MVRSMSNFNLISASISVNRLRVSVSHVDSVFFWAVPSSFEMTHHKVVRPSCYELCWPREAA